jgi:dihydrofolate reductase
VRKLIESTFMTLDGVISSPQDWGSAYWDEEHARYSNRLLEDAGSLLLGRETYDVFAAVWPARAGDPYADRINRLPKHVASTTLSEARWNTSVLEGDVASAVAELKQQAGGSILKFGTGQLDRTLLGHGLLDELHLWIFPVVAGAGERLLEGATMTQLTLLDTTTFASGIVVHVYGPRDRADA